MRLATLALVVVLLSGCTSVWTTRQRCVEPIAICRDGVKSCSAERKGTCSGHDGVRVWLRKK